MSDNEIPKLKNDENYVDNIEQSNEIVDEEETVEEVKNNVQEKIEIPKEYYEKIEKEKQERLKKLEEEDKKNEELKGSGSTFISIIFNCLVFFGLLYLMINKTKYAIFAIPGYIVLLSIFTSLSKKKDNNYNVTVLVSGMIVALICFLVGTSNKEQEDLYIYYAMASAVIGFAGYVLSSIICKIVGDSKNIKALQTIFYLLVLGAMVGGPYYYYTNHKEDFIKLVFNEKDAIIATTEEEYIISNLKSRYNVEVSCSKDIKNGMDYVNKRMVSTRTCNIGGKNTSVSSLAYDTTNVLYIVRDSLLDDLYIKEMKKTLKNEISGLVASKNVTISLYPDNKCYYIGDCENNDNYVNEINLDNMYKYGRELKLDNYLNISKEEFFNQYGFRIVILVKANFLMIDSTYLKGYVDDILNILSTKGYKNVKGFEVILEDIETLDIIYHAKGNTNDKQTFSDYDIVPEDD